MNENRFLYHGTKCSAEICFEFYIIAHIWRSKLVVSYLSVPKLKPIFKKTYKTFNIQVNVPD